MFIQTEQTPNPLTIKFLPGKTVMERGVAEFTSKEKAVESPLAEQLFQLGDVTGVFFGSDFVSVTKDEEASWETLKTRIMAVIMEHFTIGQPLFAEGFSPQEKESASEDDDDEITAQIKELLDTRVRPMVAMDGGDIVFEKFEDGVVYLQMRGACSGCPSATMTLKSGVENMLRHYVPEVLEVRQSAA
ncbi:MAG: NifU family protein [Alphaproteobacteria bacterium]|nr:NifU family protein [Alphaproteobacteria bacterium]